MKPLLVLVLVALPFLSASVRSSPPQQALDYQMGPGDIVSVRVAGVKEFELSGRISNSGRLRVPYVGIMFVSGKTALQVEREIAKQIMEHELVNEPSVRVQIEQYRSQPAYVIGDVVAPGQFMITGEMYLLDLLAKAGGLLAGAEEKGVLYRRNAPQPNVETRLITPEDRPATVAKAPLTPAVTLKSEEVIQVDFKALREGTRPELNLRVQGGDILFVPRLREETIYIIGDVNVPGAYILPRRGQITALQAVIYAGGPLKTAKWGSSFVMRHNAAGQREALPINFGDILRGKKPDFPVKPDDIIFIPNSTAKTVGVAMYEMLPRLLQQFLIF